MSFLYFWGVSSIACIMLELNNNLRIFKDLAKMGYILDISNVDTINKTLFKDKSLFLTSISLVLPIINIFFLAKRILLYFDIREDVVDYLINTKLAKEMTDEENDKFLKWPTSTRAFMLTAVSKKKRIKEIMENKGGILYFKLLYNKIQSEAYFILKDNDQDMDILYCDGPLSLVALDEQKKIIYTYYTDAVNNFIEQKGSMENVEEIKDTYEIKNNDEGKLEQEKIKEKVKIRKRTRKK